jgi:hypothetical protein
MTSRNRFLKLAGFCLFLGASASAQQRPIYEDSLAINPGQVEKFVDGDVQCYLATKRNVINVTLTSSLSCIGDTSKVSTAVTFLGGQVVRIRDGGSYCYYYATVRSNALSCLNARAPLE